MQLGVIVCYAAAQVVALGLQGRGIGDWQHQLHVYKRVQPLAHYISNTWLGCTTLRQLFVGVKGSLEQA